MERKIKWRTFWLAVLTVLAVCTLIPSLVPSEKLPPAFEDVFNKKIQLGLDLQGGLHIVYSIDLNKAVDDKASEIKRDLDEKLAEREIPGRVSTPLSPTGAVTVIVDNPEDKAKIDSQFLSDYDEIITFRDCPDAQKDTAVCIRVSSDFADSIKSTALSQAIKTIRNRIDARGVSEPTVITKGDQIIVELPGLDEEAINRVKDIIARTAKLEFKIVDEKSEYMRALYNRVKEGDPLAQKENIETYIDQWRHDDSATNYSDYYLTAPKEKEEYLDEAEANERACAGADTRQKGGKYLCKISGREIIERYIEQLVAEDPKFKIDDDHMLGFELVQPGSGPEGENRDPYWRTYYLHRAVELSGSAVSDAYVYWNSTSNRPEVLIDFNRYGGRRFGDLTGRNVGRKMAIILDDKVESAPTIQSKIAGGRSSITMGGGSDQAAIQRDAQDLVSVLKTGSLPAPLQEESSSVVGPLLGKDAVNKAKFSFMLGAGLVMIIMIWFYRMSGVISMFALALNILFMLAMLATFGATLTLPGIAAVVLTVGMAVDANIIIYERIREELRLGKSVRGAVDAGFSRGFSAILDGQITTGVAAYVLMQYGSGPIRGFAVMLMIGITCTLFTATWCTRLFFEWYVGRGRKNPVLGI